MRVALKMETVWLVVVCPDLEKFLVIMGDFFERGNEARANKETPSS